jgi:hypothetical protein
MPTKRSKPDDEDTLNDSDYMKLRVIFSEHTIIYADSDQDDGPIADLDYHPREYTAHVQIVRGREEWCTNATTRQILDHVMDKAELFVETFLYDKLIRDGYCHYCYRPSGENMTQQWTLIKLM